MIVYHVGSREKRANWGGKKGKQGEEGRDKRGIGKIERENGTRER